MKKSILLLLTALALQCAPGKPLYAQAAASSPLEAKLALENSLEKRLRLVLSEALGTEDIIIIISAEMQEQDKKAAFEIMPGIPEKGKVGEMSLSSSLTMVKKLSANLILDKSVSEEDTKLAVKLAAGLLGLPPERQDLISVEKMNFRKARPLSVADLLAPPNIWNAAWILLVAALILAVVFVFLAPLTRTAGAFVEAFNAKNAAPADDTARQERAAEAQDKTAREQAKADAAAVQQTAASDGRKPPFWFLSAANPANLAFIMQSHAVEDITILLSYAPGDLASKLAEALYPRSVEALAALPTIKLVPEARVRQLEAELQTALDYVVGGEDKALNILNNLDESLQEKALTAFTSIDPAMSKKLGASVVKLSDVQNLEPAHAQALARRIPIRVLASALKTTTYVEVFVGKLASGMQERIRQELDLTRVMPASAYKADRAQVVAALRQMMAEGFITKSGTSAAAPAALGNKKPLPAYFQTPGGAPAPHGAHPAIPGAAPRPGGPAPLPGLPPGVKPPVPAAPLTPAPAAPKAGASAPPPPGPAPAPKH
ncbi:MAG TPA: hypothetical protein DCZ92_01000 [Elusimicrobia bacterium]|nr:MAG: hypothetical protein A2016_04695 [Elusimicrobia bacterium GWF2_62_30]HBA59404.1 hypothetical protein [Elusimicrobiota bacterium]